MRHKILLLMLLMVASIAHASNTIIVLGDSLSAGYGIAKNLGWVNLLQQRLQQQGYQERVVNASITGDTTAGGVTRLPALLRRYKPKITIIELGGNDGLQGLSLTASEQNLLQLVTLAKQYHSQVLLLGVRIPPNYGPLYTQQFQQMYLDLKKTQHVELVPLFLDGIDEHPELMQADRIHPTAAAQSRMLENVWPTLHQLLNAFATVNRS